MVQPFLSACSDQVSTFYRDTSHARCHTYPDIDTRAPRWAAESVMRTISCAQTYPPEYSTSRQVWPRMQGVPHITDAREYQLLHSLPPQEMNSHCRAVNRDLASLYMSQNPRAGRYSLEPPAKHCHLNLATMTI